MAADLRIGISGWTYAPWRGTFFPPDLKQREELAYASRHLRSIEINGTFYSLQRPASYASWAAQTPDDFIFSVKAPRFVTHIRRLKDIGVPVANFFASGVLRLGSKLGPILWQLPPSLPYDHARLAEFFRLLPRDGASAVKLARQHDAHVALPWLQAAGVGSIRHALEVRHASFLNPEFIALLRAHEVALVVADTAGKWPFMEDVTADFVYVRLHGDEELYVSGYTPAALKTWAGKVRAWSRGRDPAGAATVSPSSPPARAERDVFVYFDNDVKVRAPYDAMTLAHALGTGPLPDTPPPIAQIAETPRTRWPGYGPRLRAKKSAAPKVAQKKPPQASKAVARRSRARAADGSSPR